MTADHKQGVAQAAFVLAELLQQQLNKESLVVLGLVGGRSMPAVLSTLASYDVEWNRVHVFLMDERLVPLDSPLSNFHQLQPALTFLPEENRHPFHLDSSVEDKGITEYQREYDNVKGRFDVCIVSAGEDGHIASLFPHHPSITNESKGYLLVDHAPKPPAQRMSCSKSLLLTSKAGVIVFLGKEKQKAYQMYTNEATKMIECPAKLMSQLPQTITITDF